MLFGGNAYRSAAAVHIKIGRRRHATDEPEHGQERVEHERDDGVEGERLFQAGWEEVQQAEEGEDAAEEIVRDHGAVAARRDVVAGERNDEDGPEELHDLSATVCDQWVGFYSMRAY